MLIIWAKLSDIYGRKLFAVASITVFTLFSGGCGAAQTMTQLCVFESLVPLEIIALILILLNRIALRAFQGLGGGGNFALGSIIFMELVPAKLYPKYTSMVSVVFSLSLLLGPIFGGALNHLKTWRWVFLLK